MPPTNAPCLVLDVSQLVGYACSLEFDAWSDGMAWRRNGAMDEDRIDTEPGIPLVLLLGLDEAQEWAAAIPEAVREALLRYPELFQDTSFLALWHASRSVAAHELLVDMPVLFGFMMDALRRGRLDPGALPALWFERRTVILKALGLPASRAMLRLLKRLDDRRIRPQLLDALIKVGHYSDWQRLNHHRWPDVNLIMAVADDPRVLNARYFTVIDKRWFWPRYRMLVGWIRHLVGVREGDAAQAWRYLGVCADMAAIERLHERLSRAFQKTARDIPRTAYGPPPLPGSAEIEPITDSDQLAEEGRRQHHCIFSYHSKILEGYCYVYRVLAPERATLLIDWPNGLPRLAEIRAASNASVRPDTRLAVQQWFGPDASSRVDDHDAF